MRPFVLFFCLIWICPVFAQLPKIRIDGKPEKKETEIVAVRDANGRFCAAIQVQTNTEGMSYDFYNGGCVWIKNPART